MAAESAKSSRQFSPTAVASLVCIALIGGYGIVLAVALGEPNFLVLELLGVGIGWSIGALAEGLESV